MASRKESGRRLLRTVLLVICSGTVLALVVLLIALSAALSTSMRQWDDELATLMATDASIAAPGDGARAILFTDEELLLPGQTADLGEVQVTLRQSARERLEIEDEIEFGQNGHWSVHFLFENIRDTVIYLHPVVGSQMQFLVEGAMIWRPSTTTNCTPPVEEVVPEGIQPGAQVSCTQIYVVPVDGRNLYWVYTTHIPTADGYQEMYVAYQVFTP